MLIKYQKIIADKLKEKNISLDLFEVKQEKNKSFSTIPRTTFVSTKFQVKNSGLHFSVAYSDSYDQFRTYYSRFDPKSSETHLYPPSGRPGMDIIQVVQNFDSWLDTHFKNYMDEILTRNPWQETYQYSFDSVPNFDNAEENFTTQEAKVVRSVIKQLETNITNINNITSDQINFIINKINFLDKKVDELNKFDWKSLFLGTIVNIITSLSLTPETSGLILNWIKELFSKAFPLLN